jgi:hypothetical protein
MNKCNQSYNFAIKKAKIKANDEFIRSTNNITKSMRHVINQCRPKSTQTVPQASPDDLNIFFLFCTYKTVSITLKRVSKRKSFRYAFQEHLLQFLMLAVTDSELCYVIGALHDTLNSKLTIVPLFTSVTNPYICQI